MIDIETNGRKGCFNRIFRGSYQDAVQYADTLAKERQSKVTILNCEELKQPGDLAGLLTSLNDDDILFLYGVNLVNEEHIQYFQDAIKKRSISIELDRYASQSINMELGAFNILVYLNDGEILPTYLLTAIYNNAFLYICHNNEMKDYIDNLCQELDSRGIPYYYSPLSNYNGWNTIRETVSTISSAKYVLCIFKGILKDDYAADELEFAKRIKRQYYIIEYDFDETKDSVSSLCKKFVNSGLGEKN